MNSFSSGDMHNPDLMPSLEIPYFKNKNLKLNQRFYPPPSLGISVSNLSEISASGLVSQSLHSPYPNMYMPSRTKRFRGPDSSFPGLNAEPLMFSAACNHNSTSAHVSSSTALLSGNHAALNGNPSSSSEPAWATKELELPSLQNQTGRWCNSPSSPLHSLESMDTIIQTPPTENIHSLNLFAQNSGLLDAVLFGSQSLRNPDSNTSTRISQISGTSDVVVDNSSQDHFETECEAYGESFSSLYHSASVFNDSTPASGNLTDKPPSVQQTKGRKVHDDSSLASIHHHNYANRPDLLLESSYYIPQYVNKDDSSLKDTIGDSLLFDDLNSNCMSML